MASVEGWDVVGGGEELWRGQVDGRTVRLVLLDGLGLAIDVGGLGVVAMDIRDWYRAALFLVAAAESGESVRATLSDAEREARAWTRH